MKPVALAVALTACGGRAAPAPSEVRLHLEVEPPHLNAFLSGDAQAVRVTLGDVQEPLWELDDAGAMVPVLAESWWRSADDRDWIVTLRRGATWHDGKPFTTRDVVFTFELLAHGAPSPLCGDVDDLEEIVATGEATVRLRFRGFRLERERNLARVPILPAHVFAGADLPAHPASRAPVGTGPYRFDAWIPGEEIRVRRHDGYWGRRPVVDRVVYRIVPDRGQAIAQLRAGQLDALAHVPASELESFPVGSFETQPYPAHSFLAVTWNTRRAPLGDARVRRALTQLLDRDSVIREIYHGRAVALSGPWPPAAPATDARIAPWPFDPAAARALLAEAGVTEARLTLVIPKESRVLERIATIWQEDAKAAGVTLSVEAVPWPEVLGRAKAGDFDGVAYSWTTSPEQDLYNHLHSSQNRQANHGAMSDPELDRLLDAVRTTPDAAARTALEHQLHRRLHDLQPLTFVCGDVRTAVVSRRLQDARFGPTGLRARRISLALL